MGYQEQDTKFNLIMPVLYKDMVSLVLKVAKEILKDNLVSIMLSGSGGKNNIIPFWSDLDFYVVVKCFNIDITNFYRMFLDSKVHIGFTFYTLFDLNKKRIDNKTLVALLERKLYNVNPIIYGNDVFPSVSFDEVVENDRQNISNMLHIIRRYYLKEALSCDKVSVGYIKKLTVLVKCILGSKGIYVLGYENVYKKFSILTNTLLFPIMKVIETRDKALVLDFTRMVFKILEGGIYEKSKCTCNYN